MDECHISLAPVVVDGTRSLPDGVRLELDLVDERRFGNGTVYLRYRRKWRSQEAGRGRAAVAALARDEVVERGAGEGRVVSELLSHHPRRRALGKAEALAERDAALEGVAVGHALVGRRAGATPRGRVQQRRV